MKIFPLRFYARYLLLSSIEKKKTAIRLLGRQTRSIHPSIESIMGMRGVCPNITRISGTEG